MRARQIQAHVERQQAELERRQAEIAKQTSQLSSELEHRIDNMEIHKLMDLVDAPRIILPIPTPAAIAQWAQIATPERQSGEAASAAGTNLNSVPPDVEVKAEADAAIELIAAKAAPPAENSAQSVAPIAHNDNGNSTAKSRSVEPALSASIEEPKESRPPWVEQAPKRVGNVRRDVVETDEYASKPECEWAADRLLQLKTYEHLQRLVGKPLDADRMHAMRNEALSVEGHTPQFLYELEESRHHDRLHPP
jgi:hypothetical protein